MSDYDILIETSGTVIDVGIGSTTVDVALEMAGPQGAPGIGTGFSQAFGVTTSVVVNHGLGYYPAVTVVDSGGDIVEPEVVYNSVNTLTINFSVPFSGVVYCS